MHTRFLLMVPVAIGLVACRDATTAPNAAGPSPPTLDPVAYELFNDPLTRQLAGRLSARLPTSATPGAGWSMNPQSATGIEPGDFVIDSAALEIIIAVAMNPPTADSGVGH